MPALLVKFVFISVVVEVAPVPASLAVLSQTFCSPVASCLLASYVHIHSLLGCSALQQWQQRTSCSAVLVDVQLCLHTLALIKSCLASMVLLAKGAGIQTVQHSYCRVLTRLRSFASMVAHSTCWCGMFKRQLPSEVQHSCLL
jgi:hypothetical protein